MWKKVVLGVVVAAVLGFLLIQLIPYGRYHTNPPVTREVAWSSPAVKELAVRACYDCHSSKTTWPWYSNVAPISWVIQHDVDEGRQKLNFSEWDKSQPNADRAAEDVSTGRMPRWYYLLLHPSAKLSDAEKKTLIDGLNAAMNAR